MFLFFMNRTTCNALERPYHCFYNGSDVIFSKKFLLKPLHYHLLPGSTPFWLWHDVLLWFEIRFVSFIGYDFAIIPAEISGVTRHLIYTFNVIHHLFEDGKIVPPPLRQFLDYYRSIYRICDYVQFFEVLSPYFYLTMPRCFA